MNISNTLSTAAKVMALSTSLALPSLVIAETTHQDETASATIKVIATYPD